VPHDSRNFVVHPAFANRLAALGLNSAEAVLDLRGEVVSGHPDRHVLRVGLPGFPSAFYLKRQHFVTRRERFRNWCAGFGWVSRAERERVVLDQLAAAGLPCPRWVAAGENGRGRAFLLVEEVTGAVDLRRALSDGQLSFANRAALANRLGRLISQYHAAGFTTPDLTAKHVLVSRESGDMGDMGDITLIDWQTARRSRGVRLVDRLRALEALHASVADDLTTPRERLRVLYAAMIPGRFSYVARRIAAEAASLSSRRSIRDQRQSVALNQRLVWVAGEAVCAIPSVAEIWPTPAIAPPFYDVPPGRLAIKLADGQSAHLIRGRSFDPLGRLTCHLRGKSWRSPGATLGRVLFHLERYGIPAPRLLAFGQRLAGRTSADWFALHTPPPPPITHPTLEVAEQLGQCLRQLHDAGCRAVLDPRLVFGMDGGVCIRDVAAIRIVKRISRDDRLDDLRRVAAALEFRAAVHAGYAEGGRQTVSNRLIPASVSE
jgi:tRNA A-37 threonylcarbamoyl transferase component Bud32